MQVLAWVLIATVLAAPGWAVCACEKTPASPAQVPMDCEGTSGCCCGDPQAPSPESARCPLAEKVLDGAENVTAAVVPQGLDAPFLAVGDLLRPSREALPARPEALSRASPPPPPHLHPTPLLL